MLNLGARGALQWPLHDGGVGDPWLGLFRGLGGLSHGAEALRCSLYQRLVALRGVVLLCLLAAPRRVAGSAKVPLDKLPAMYRLHGISAPLPPPGASAHLLNSAAQALPGPKLPAALSHTWRTCDRGNRHGHVTPQRNSLLIIFFLLFGLEMSRTKTQHNSTHTRHTRTSTHAPRPQDRGR